MTRIKICGLQTIPHALVAAKAGADYLGMIFSEPSSRRISLETGIEICAGVREAYRHNVSTAPRLAGVFVNESPDLINRVAESCGLDLVQISGDEDPSICKKLERPIIRAIRIAAGQSYRETIPQIESWLSLMPKESLLHIEGRVEGSYGGTGHVMELRTAAELAKHHPFLLAGGLTPDNVGQAVLQVAPWGVDVSSGVESLGVKDPAKVLRFILRVKAADESLSNMDRSKTPTLRE
ncbi:MAG: phosphoribosylanthranilate isomerase [Dehalococcoidia bacterium]|nr:phosphoribosylanthranilate isomerase [Dehalococcoidia bacterium]